MLLAGCSSGETQEAQRHSIGLTITSWNYALRETPEGKEECPAGLTPGTRENFAAQFPDPARREAYARQFGMLSISPQSRGPNGEDPAYLPAAVNDSLPFKHASGKHALGLNLDGTDDGKATARTCTHGKFADPDSGAPVDNQLYRVIGCTIGYRRGGDYREFVAEEFLKQPNRFLIEITDVDNERNDPDVTVTFYKGLDPLTKDANGAFIPNMSQRIDVSMGDRFVRSAKGKIVDGVLLAGPFEEVIHPFEAYIATTELTLRGAQLRLRLTDGGADGILGGYADLESWWNRFSREQVGFVINGVSPPSYWREIHALADGYPDAKSGQCTAISTAFEFTAARAYVVHPEGS